MSFWITAWMTHGESRLGMVREESSLVVHQWRLDKLDTVPRRQIVSRTGGSGMQQLARELFLIGCADEISQAHHSRLETLGDRCVFCDHCLQQVGKDDVVPIDLVKRI